MVRSKVAFALLLLAGALTTSCAGKDGKDGATGQTGAKGDPGDPGEPGADGADGADGTDGMDGAMGEQGPKGDPGTAAMLPDGTINASCLSPCHGFSGTVEQWKTSRHYATYIANLGGDEEETWTGHTACGNCHAIDGIEQRIAGNISITGDVGPQQLDHGQISYKRSDNSAITEAVYGGSATVAVVHCTTCHDSEGNDPHVTGATYTEGSFPLRVPSGADDYAVIEKSSAVGTSDGTQVKYGKGNACIWCHKSRKDVTNYVVAGNNKITSAYWGPHEGPQADIYTGKGGYHFGNNQYSSVSHGDFEDGCVKCHMPDVTDNQNVGNHSFYAQVSACQECHKGTKTFDVNSGQSRTAKSLRRLRKALNDKLLLSRDGATSLTDAQVADSDFASDEALPGQTVPQDTAGALYNYFLLARGAALSVHNPSYTSQLIYDSLVALGEDVSDLTR